MNKDGEVVIRDFSKATRQSRRRRAKNALKAILAKEGMSYREARRQFQEITNTKPTLNSLLKALNAYA